MGSVFGTQRQSIPPEEYEDRLAKRNERQAKVQREAFEKINRDQGGGGASYWVNEGTAGLRTKKKNPRKIIVTGIDPNTTEQEFHEYFKRFGEVLSVDLPLENNEIDCRGYGFIIFDDIRALDRIEQEGPHHLHGKELHVAREVERN